VAKRLRAVVLNAEGQTSGERLQRYQTDGVDGPLQGYRAASAGGTDSEADATVEDILEIGPVAYGLDTVSSAAQDALPATLTRVFWGDAVAPINRSALISPRV
jgi:hypothetical protein